RAAEGYPADEILVNVTQLLLRSRCPDALAVSSPGGRFQIERRVHDGKRHSRARRARIDRAQCEFPEAGYGGVDMKTRLLRDDRHHRTGVLSRGRQVELRKGVGDVGGPARAIGDPRESTFDGRPDVGRIGRLAGSRARTACEQKDEKQVYADPSTRARRIASWSEPIHQ